MDSSNSMLCRKFQGMWKDLQGDIQEVLQAHGFRIATNNDVQVAHESSLKIQYFKSFAHCKRILIIADKTNGSRFATLALLVIINCYSKLESATGNIIVIAG